MPRRTRHRQAGCNITVPIDLYGMLGVSRKATADVIRKAYRHRAKTAHPDVGGSKDQFALITLAHDTLLDDERRQRYDTTGEIGEKPVDNHHAELIQVIAGAFDNTMTSLLQQKRDPTRADLVALIVTTLTQYRDNITTQSAALTTNMDHVTCLLGRFTTDDENNILEALLKSKLTIFEQQRSRGDTQVALLEEAITVMGRYSFRFDQAPTTILGGGYYNFSATATG